MVQTGGVEVFALHKKSQPSPGSTKSVQPKLNHAQEGYLLDVLLHRVSAFYPHPNPSPLGQGAGILPPAGGGWEGGICANLMKQYIYSLRWKCPRAFP